MGKFPQTIDIYHKMQIEKQPCLKKLSTRGGREKPFAKVFEATASECSTLCVCVDTLHLQAIMQALRGIKKTSLQPPLLRTVWFLSTFDPFSATTAPPQKANGGFFEWWKPFPKNASFQKLVRSTTSTNGKTLELFNVCLWLRKAVSTESIL